MHPTYAEMRYMELIRLNSFINCSFYSYCILAWLSKNVPIELCITTNFDNPIFYCRSQFITRKGPASQCELCRHQTAEESGTEPVRINNLSYLPQFLQSKFSVSLCSMVLKRCLDACTGFELALKHAKCIFDHAIAIFVLHPWVQHPR